MHNNQALADWVKEWTEFLQPDNVHWCDGSQEEYDRLCNQLVEKGTFIRLNPEKRPNSFACFSDPSDVARVEDRTTSARAAKKTQALPTIGKSQSK